MVFFNGLSKTVMLLLSLLLLFCSHWGWHEYKKLRLESVTFVLVNWWINWLFITVLCNCRVMVFCHLYKNIIVLRAKHIGSFGRLKLELVYERPYGFGGQTKRCFVARTPLSQLPTFQHRHERPHCGMRVLLGAGFSSLKVANTV